MTTVLDTARRGFQAGLCLLPVRADGSKAPDVPSWLPFKTARPTPADVRAFDFAHRAGLGMIAGPVSGHRECWDFDTADVFDAFVDAADASGLGPLVARIRAGYEDTTPGGGRRWIVTYPADVVWTDCTLARRPGRDGEAPVKTLIELPTFAILAPSNGATHPSGRAYVRVWGDVDTIAAYTADEREALVALARSFDVMPRREISGAFAARTAHHGTRPGDDYNHRLTWPALLGPAGWTHVYDRGEVSYWCRPGKAHGISASTNVGGSDLFYPFTSSTVFEPEKSYSKFGAYTVLEHDGDFARAALALSAQGYGHQEAAAASGAAVSGVPADRLDLVTLSDVAPERVSWLWPGRLAHGKYTLCAGDPGLGKSTVSLAIAAHLSRGSAWPDGDKAPRGATLILSAEDGIADTIRPRLDRLGGDASQIVVLRAVRDERGARPLNLARDVDALGEALRRVEPQLVIVDPITAYLGKTDSYKDAEVRGLLAPLISLIEEARVALLAVGHLAKADQRAALHRPGGSIAFVAAARIVLCLATDPTDADRRVLAGLKSNLAPLPPSLAFRLPDGRLEWERGPVTLDAEALLRPSSPRDRDEQTDAERVIVGLLTDESVWPLEARQALAAGTAHGVHERSMQRAARKLGIQIRRLGFGTGGKWLWHRPTIPDTPANTPVTPDVVSSMSSMEEHAPKTTHTYIDDTLTFTDGNGRAGTVPPFDPKGWR